MMASTPHTDDRQAAIRASNRRLGLIMASIAAAFFLGVIAKYWFLNG